MSSEAHPHTEVGHRFIRAIVRGDADAAINIYADDCVVWRNFDGRSLPKRSAAKVVRFLIDATRVLSYDNLVLTPTESGYVQQHVLRGLTQSGEAFEAPACLVVTLVGDRIARIDEYLDPSQLAPLMK